MKSRSGFVSNSSSSSFLMYGAYVEDRPQTICKINELLYGDDESKYIEYLCDAILEFGLEWENPFEEDVFGLSLDNIGMDETMREFQLRVDTKMKELFGADIKCAIHEEAWRDG